MSRPSPPLVEFVETQLPLPVTHPPLVELVETHAYRLTKQLGETVMDPVDNLSPSIAIGHTGQMPWVYILECADGSFYVGSARDVDARVEQHQLGLGAAYTRRPGRGPVRLAWATEFASVGEAYQAEKQIQGWSRAKRLALIEGRFTDLPALARGRTGRPKDASS